MTWRRVRSAVALVGVLSACASVPTTIIVVNKDNQQRVKDGRAFTALVERRFEDAQMSGRVRGIRSACVLRGIIVIATTPPKGRHLRPAGVAFRDKALGEIDANLRSLGATAKDCL